MFILIFAIVGALFGARAGGGEETLSGIFFALVGLIGGGYLGSKLEKGFEADAKEKRHRQMQAQKEREDREYEERRRLKEEGEST